MKVEGRPRGALRVFTVEIPALCGLLAGPPPKRGSRSARPFVHLRLRRVAPYGSSGRPRQKLSYPQVPQVDGEENGWSKEARNPCKGREYDPPWDSSRSLFESGPAIGHRPLPRGGQGVHQAPGGRPWPAGLDKTRRPSPRTGLLLPCRSGLAQGLRSCRPFVAS